MNLDKDTIKKLRGLIFFTVFLLAAMLNLSFIGTGIRTLFKLIFPFLLGGCIAFILNVPMSALENKLFHQIKSKGLRRGLSLVSALLLVIGIIFIVMFLVIPELGTTFLSLSKSVPVFVERLLLKAEQLFHENPQIVEKLQTIEFNWEAIFNGFLGFFKNGAGNFLGSTVNVAMNIVSSVTAFFIALVFSFYILLQKEKLGRQSKMILAAFLPDKYYERILKIASLTYTTFASFLSGQCIEAVILGSMFFVTMSILRFPYALLIGVLIAFTALIPIFGAFIGCIVGTFLILMVSPMQALWFIVLFNVLQQIEGNLIYPKVVGGSVGLPSMWVLVAVTLGANTMGVAGMLIFIPLTSVIYALFRETVYQRLKVRKKDPAKL
ncbi:AI-2E family transporter [Acetivibrio ethanolgignens]|uniref:Permease n=1 Tax=Acetivibrio ethanolgignens TaxID=290052 RepID=A0A0V8QGY2_9FIRM|nr:AI-2E family transporter [Acetivibrio ethanolgignens]KSV59853.1 hypothetical protein ASU35_07565 [Acetivibrio ethanolgignens]